jgi:hypothetical protein
MKSKANFLQVIIVQRGIMCTKYWSRGLKGRDHSEILGVVGRIILKWILGK